MASASEAWMLSKYMQQQQLGRMSGKWQHGRIDIELTLINAKIARLGLISSDTRYIRHQGWISSTGSGEDVMLCGREHSQKVDARARFPPASRPLTPVCMGTCRVSGAVGSNAADPEGKRRTGGVTSWYIVASHQSQASSLHQRSRTVENLSHSPARKFSGKGLGNPRNERERFPRTYETNLHPRLLLLTPTRAHSRPCCRSPLTLYYEQSSGYAHLRRHTTMAASAPAKEILVSPATSNDVKFERGFEQVFSSFTLNEAFSRHPAFNAVFKDKPFTRCEASWVWPLPLLSWCSCSQMP